MDWARLWALDRDVAFLNHGSYGACPLAVLDAQQRLRERLERQPVGFLGRELERLLDAARAELAALVGADARDLAFVPNATAGTNAVLRSLRFEPGDELLTTDHAYNACRNAIEFAAGRAGARVVVAPVPFPIDGPDRVVEAVLQHVTPRTRLAVLDHVTSPTGLIFPIARLVAELAGRGVDTLVDGAHAPGMLPLDVRAIGAAYYTGTCHKWLCAPKGAAFLYVRRDAQPAIRPLAISHGANSPRTDRPRFHLEFDWTGTDDPTPYLCVPEAVRFMGSLLPGGWPALMARNRTVALDARATLCETLGAPLPCPDAMIGSLAALPLPDGSSVPPVPRAGRDPLQAALLERFSIEVPIMAWPRPPRRLIRISAQLYNSAADYQRLARALAELLGS
ncbi:MAG: aminotransferase class V-fold PLP-dependent enzyme [Candidatus Rokubacteria bacterium]|nr:aminotransferase class V-fold PLP-dependent enzyme [Candidatus Rokubacteria bacterium]